MRKILMIGAAFVMGATPMAVTAQDNVGGTNSIEDKRGYDSLDDLNETERAEYDAWPAEYQTAYADWPSNYRASYWGWPADYRTSYWAWPSDYQTYYWTLTPEQQDAYWVLTDDQRAKIYAMTPEQRTAAWNSIASQMAEDTSASGSASIEYNSNAMVQSVPQTSPDEYPICKGDIQDSCINPREAGKSWGNRPLDYWPGKPASKM